MPYNLQACYNRIMNEEIRKRKNREHFQRWWVNNKEAHRNRVNAGYTKRKGWFKRFKATLKCSRCGESRPAALDFHHPNSNEELIIAKLAGHTGNERLLKEIAKCEVLCANCHREEHFGRYYK